jgi:hypothetical protein
MLGEMDVQVDVAKSHIAHLSLDSSLAMNHYHNRLEEPTKVNFLDVNQVATSLNRSACHARHARH